MRKIALINIFIFFILCLSKSQQCFGVESSEVVIADEIRTAYYERAPKSLRDSMSRAVKSLCSSTKEIEGANVSKWLCQNNKLNYFRSVYVNGNKGAHGLVCEENSSDFFKYFGVDLVPIVLNEGDCISANFDGKNYELVIEEDSFEENT